MFDFPFGIKRRMKKATIPAAFFIFMRDTLFGTLVPVGGLVFLWLLRLRGFAAVSVLVVVRLFISRSIVHWLIALIAGTSARTSAFVIISSS